MFIGHLTNLEQESKLYPTAIQVGLNFLLTTDFSTLPLGRHEIQNDKIYATYAEYETEPKEQRRPESHQRYVDIQYVYSGEEVIGSAPLSTITEIAEDHLAERDLIFYKDVTSETFHVLSQGMFAVFFPWDVHRPNCNSTEQTRTIRKIVVKIAVELLTNSI